MFSSTENAITGLDLRGDHVENGGDRRIERARALHWCRPCANAVIRWRCSPGVASDIEDAATEAGSGAAAIECDVTDEASVRSAIDSAAEALGGIDNLVYTPAIGPLVRLVDTDADTWGRVFATNVTGAALATAAAVPHLTRSAGKVVYSLVGRRDVRTAVARPRRLRRQQGRARKTHRGMARRAPGHRVHQPHRRRMRRRRRRLGDGNQHRLGHGARHGALPQWVSRGCMPGQLMPIDDLVEVVHTILQTNSATSMPVVIARGRASYLRRFDSGDGNRGLIRTPSSQRSDPRPGASAPSGRRVRRLPAAATRPGRRRPESSRRRPGRSTRPSGRRCRWCRKPGCGARPDTSRGRTNPSWSRRGPAAARPTGRASVSTSRSSGNA